MWNKLKFSIHWRVRALLERLNILFGHEWVLVYTMGKVGSTSLYYSLKKKLGPKVMFIHRMNVSNIASYNKPFLQNGIKPHGSSLALFAKQRIIDKGKPVSIISAVREPISRNISDFFQDFKVYNHGKDFTEVKIEKAIQNFINNYPHHLPDNWFKEEFSTILGIDLQDIKFDRAEKYGTVSHGNIKVLFLRTDLNNDAKLKVLQQFLSRKNIKLRVKNTHSQKAYRDYYAEFLETIELSTAFVNRMYSEEYLQLFYTQEEIKSFRERWLQ